MFFQLINHHNFSRLLSRTSTRTIRKAWRRDFDEVFVFFNPKPYLYTESLVKYGGNISKRNFSR